MRTRAVLILAAVVAAATIVFRHAGSWLVVEDPLQHARAVVVLGGQVPFRAMEAARVYQGGWAPVVWVSRGFEQQADIQIRKLGIDDPPEYEFSRQVLEHFGVPDRAIEILPEQAINTAAEVRQVARLAESEGGGPVIIITSKYHGRRVRILWHELVGRSVDAIIRYTPDDPFDPVHWWRTSTDGTSVLREWIGVMNAWTGFPIKSDR